MENKGTPPATLPGAQKELANIPGAEPSARLDAWWWLVAAVLAIVIALIVFIPGTYLRMWNFIKDGIVNTIWITVVSFLATLILGLFGALGRISKNKILNLFTSLYVEIIRGIPLLVQLIWWYFAAPAIIRNFGSTYNIPMLANYVAPGILMAIIGLTICYGAYMTEIYRAGIQSIPPGQMEAARSLGMNYFQAMRYIIFPQAVRVILPPVGNEFTALLKDSSLVSAVVISDLTRRGREFVAISFQPIETYTFIALLYLIMTLVSARIATFLERRFRISERK
jgi:polar amino acid transport system permease protein